MQLKMHGEVNFYQVKKMPAGAVRYNPKASELINGKLIVGESETSGNHHVVDAHEQKVEFYELNGQLYMKVKQEISAECVHKGRHDKMTIEPGIYKRKIAQEYDYFTQSKRNVAD